MTLKTGIRAMFDNLIFAADDRISVETAQRLAQELGFDDFDPAAYDH